MSCVIAEIWPTWTSFLQAWTSCKQSHSKTTLSIPRLEAKDIASRRAKDSAIMGNIISEFYHPVLIIYMGRVMMPSYVMKPYNWTKYESLKVNGALWLKKIERCTVDPKTKWKVWMFWDTVKFDFGHDQKKNMTSANIGPFVLPFEIRALLFSIKLLWQKQMIKYA